MMKRRQFIKRAAGSAVVAGFPTIVPSSVFGENAPSNRIHHGVIGAGGRSRYINLGRVGRWVNEGSVLTMEDIRMVAVADPKRRRADSFARTVDAKYGAGSCTAYQDFRELLERDDIDCVLIATPDHWHVPAALLAVRAGKDIMVEKPLSTSLSWAKALREEIEQTGAVFQYGTQQRSYSQFRKACELVRNGYIGEIKEVHSWCPDMSQQFSGFHHPPYGSTRPEVVPPGFDFDMWIGPAPMNAYTVDRCTNLGAYHIYDYSLGFIAGWGAHPLDIQQWGLDMDHTGPVWIEGRGVIPPPGSLADSVESWDVEGEYANGIRMRLMGERVARPVVKSYHYTVRDHGTTFFGEDGWISVDRTAMYSSDRSLAKAEMRSSDLRLPVSQNHDRNFFDCVRSREQPISPFEAAMRSDTISHLGDLAIRTGQRVEWDPETEQVTNGVNTQGSTLDRELREPWSRVLEI